MNPEIAVATHNLTFGADVSYGSLTERHDYFDIYVNSSGVNTQATAKLFANAGGLRVLVGQAFIPDNCGSQRIPLDTVAENFPNTEAGGVTFDLAIQSTNPAGTGTSLQAGLVGYDYPTILVQSVASGGPVTLNANGTESTIATLNGLRQFSDVSVSVPNNSRAVRFTLYAQIGTGGTLMTAPAGRITLPANTGAKIERILAAITFVGAERFILRANVDTNDNQTGTATVTAGVVIGYNENIDGGSGPSPGGLPPNVVTLEEFGAVGDGTTNDSAAMAAAITAIATGGAILLGTKNYLIGAGAPYLLPANTSIIGFGDNSRLSTVSNTTLLQANGQNVTFENFRIIGNSVGAAQNGIDLGAFPAGPCFEETRVVNVSFESLGDAGIFLPAGGDGFQHGPLISGCRFANIGVYAIWCLCEYTRIIGCDITASVTAIRVQAGNMLIDACTITGNTTGIQLVAGGNDGHGIVSDCEINHNATSVTADTILKGMSFIGCHIFSDDPPGIILTNADGIVFEDCVLDVEKYDIDSSNGVVFRNNQIFGARTNAINNLNGTSALWEENINLNGTPFSNQFLGFTFAADANQTLTSKESLAEDIQVNDGVITNIRTITSQTTPDLARPIFIRNNQAALAINFGWATGATVAIAAGTSARIVSDGVAAVKMIIAA